MAKVRSSRQIVLAERCSVIYRQCFCLMFKQNYKTTLFYLFKSCPQSDLTEGLYLW